MQESIIETIYDAPTAQQPWQDALRRLRLETGATSVMLKLTPTQQIARSQLLADSARDHRVPFAEYRREYQFRDPVLYRKLEPGRCYDFLDIASPDQMAQSDYFTNFCQRFGIGHAFYLYLGHHEGYDVMFAGSREPDAGPFTSEQFNCLRSMYPHMARAVRTHCRIHPLAANQWAWSRSLNRTGLTTALLDAAGEVITANGVAESHLGPSGIIGEVGRKLAGRTAGHLHGDVVGSPKTLVQRLQSHSGRMVQVIAEVIPAEAPAAIIGGAWQIWLQEEDTHQEPLDNAKLSQLFGLTSAEARFASSLVVHEDIVEAAKACGLTRESARTYRKRIMEKVGVSTQPALFLLLGSSLARFH